MLVVGTGLMTSVLTLASQQWPRGGHCFQQYVACGVTEGLGGCCHLPGSGEKQQERL